MLDRVLRFIIFSFVCIPSFAQEDVQVRGGFLQDSLGIGEVVDFWLVTTYPPEQDILMPDSTHNFNPFEYSSREYFTTTIRNGLAVDSAVYKLQSFEIDSVQQLSLPITLFEGGDSAKIRSNTDQIIFKELAPVVTDTTTLKANYDYMKVAREFNFTLWGIILGVLGILIFVSLLIFGKQIRKYFQLRTMKKDYRLFSEKFEKLLTDIKQSPQNDRLEKTLALWKNYVEKLENEPFSKLTTTEILSYSYTGELKDALRSIDKAIYGNVAQQDILKSFQIIEDYTAHRYSLKRTEVKNG